MARTAEPGHGLSRSRRAVLPWPAHLSDPTERLPRSHESNPSASTASTARPLIGREDDIRLIRELLIESGVRIVTVTGEPGVGKTRVALALASSLIDSGQRAGCVVDLETISPLVGPLAAIGDQLGTETTSGADRLEGIAAAIGDTPFLLVLDHFEHVLDERQDIARLVARCPRLSVLVTSRTRLRLREERVVLLSPFQLDKSVHAVELFQDRAAAALPGFHIQTESDASTVAEICRRLDGIPLAIELAAQRMRMFRTLQALLTRMDWGVLPLLVDGPYDGPGRHASMAATIAWSVTRLSTTAQATLRRLSVFRGSFSAVAAACLADGVAASANDHIDGLQVLLDHGLLQAEPSRSSEPRFRLRTVVREFARVQLAESGELDAVEQHYVAWFVQLAETAEDELRGRNQLIWLDRLSEDLEDIRAVLGWADQNEEVEVGARVATALGTFWELRANPGEGRAWLSNFLKLNLNVNLESERPVDTFFQARLLAATGAAASLKRDYAEAKALLEQACVLLSELGNRRHHAWALLGLGAAALGLGDMVGAADAYGRCLELFRQTGIAAGEGWSLLGLAQLARRQHQSIETWGSLYWTAVDTWRRVGDRFGTATALRWVADAAHVRGDFEGAAELYRESVSLFQELEFDAGTAWSLNGMGDVERSQNHYSAAESLYAEALRLFRRVSDDEGIAWVSHNLACVLLNRMELGPAAALLRESLMYFTDNVDSRGSAACLATTARAALGLRDADAAVQLLQAADMLDREATVDAQIAERAQALARSILEAAMGNSTTLGQSARRAVLELTPRERQVVVKIALGLKDREIASALMMGRSTASWHVRNVLGKLGLARAQVGIWALENGLLSS